MKTIPCKCASYAFSLSFFLLFSGSLAAEKIRAANLGGWLVVERWMKPSLFDGIPNGDLLDGTQVQLKSVTRQQYVCAENGGGSSVSVNRTNPSGWETFMLWRVTENKFQFRTFGGQFLSCDGQGCILSATANSPSNAETFILERGANDRVHIKLQTGEYWQATSLNSIRGNYPDGQPGWDDNKATFVMNVSNRMGGEYQLANGLGPDKAREVFANHRNSYITADEFKFMSQNGINAVRIPVGWWTAMDPNPPAPFVAGSLAALDNAFSWAQTCGIKVIVDLHAAPGSQNGFNHSAARDSFIEWPKQEHITQSLQAIDFFSRRYAKHPALLGIELLNEPLVAGVPLDVLVSFYKRGYDTVRKYTSTAYVLVCQRIGNSDPMELFQANIGPSNLVVDLHYYNLYSSMFENMSVEDNINYVYNTRKGEVQRFTNLNGPLVFIGEWVNEIVKRGASQADYQRYGKAQLDVFGASSFGWAYWSYKNVLDHWSLEWNINNKYLLLGN